MSDDAARNSAPRRGVFDLADHDIRPGDRFRWPAAEGDAVQTWCVVRTLGPVDPILVRVEAVRDDGRGPVRGAGTDAGTDARCGARIRVTDPADCAGGVPWTAVCTREAGHVDVDGSDHVDGDADWCWSPSIGLTPVDGEFSAHQHRAEARRRSAC